MILDQNSNEILYSNSAMNKSHKNGVCLDSDLEMASEPQNDNNLAATLAKRNHKKFAKIDKRIFQSENSKMR